MNPQQRLHQLLSEYAQSHQNPINKILHKICVPAIEFSILGLLMCAPKPAWMVHLNWADVLIIFALVYYAQFRNLKVLFGTGLMVIIFVVLLNLLKPHLLIISASLFIVAWTGQFIGHHIEGRKPSFFTDIFFLLIGPLWVLKQYIEIE